MKLLYIKCNNYHNNRRLVNFVITGQLQFIELYNRNLSSFIAI